MKSFALYGSGGCSRILKLYGQGKSDNLPTPNLVFYDGKSDVVIGKLKDCFPDQLILLNRDSHASDVILSYLEKEKISYLFCFGTLIFKGQLLKTYTNRIINMHPSLLPSFPGLNSIDQALAGNVSYIGNTAHFIVEEVDSGKIITQSIMNAKDFESYEDVLELQLPMFRLILRDLLNYALTNEEIHSDISERKKWFDIPNKCQV